MPLVLLLIIIFMIPEETLEYMLGAILGGGYGILMIIAFVAILYGIYKFFSDLWNGRQNGNYLRKQIVYGRSCRYEQI